jgi:hypothetical protein
MEHTLCIHWPSAGNAFRESSGLFVKQGAVPRHLSPRSPPFQAISVASPPENSRITRS